DRSGMILEFNHRAVEMWGRTPVIGDTNHRFCGSLKMMRPDGSLMPHQQCPVADVLSGKVAAVHDAGVTIERPDGSRISVIVNILPPMTEPGDATGAMNCFYDSTDRLKAEALLEHSEVRYRRLFEAAHDGILIL